MSTNPASDVPTPRTDEMVNTCGDFERIHSYVRRLTEFARGLERELAAARVVPAQQADDARIAKLIEDVCYFCSEDFSDGTPTGESAATARYREHFARAWQLRAEGLRADAKPPAINLGAAP